MSTALPGILMITAGVACYLIALYCKTNRPQHAGGGEGALTVWQLIAHVEDERRQRERTGRHRLREPRPEPPPSPEPPTLDVQRRILEALHHF